jgi:hypothetical protein
MSIFQFLKTTGSFTKEEKNVRSEIFMVVKIQIIVFSVMIPCSLPEDGGETFVTAWSQLIQPQFN